MGALTNSLIDLALLHDTSLTRDDRESLSYYRHHGLLKFTVVEPGPQLLPAIRAAEFLGISPELFKKVRDWAERIKIPEGADPELEVALQGLRGIEMGSGTRLFSRQSLVKFSRGEIEFRLTKLEHPMGPKDLRLYTLNPVEAAG